MILEKRITFAAVLILLVAAFAYLIQLSFYRYEGVDRL
jgi:hypothetical protein